MKILHYALGFYPYRTGGLTAYVMDVMEEQKKQGHEPALLWPGTIRLLGKRQPSIKKSSKSGIISFEMINPLPVPLMEGVADIPAYMRKCDKQIFVRFLEQYQPEVIHIHTFMGLYAEFVQAAGELHIPIAYTTHDYYPLCPTVNLNCHGENCENGMEDEKCTCCNQGALPWWKILLMQSGTYRLLKNMTPLRKMRNQYHMEKQEQREVLSKVKQTLPYHMLKGYYKDMLQAMNCILCNSPNAMEVYRRLGDVGRTRLVPITNRKVKDRRRKQEYKAGSMLAITYLGAANDAKGYFFLRDILDELYQEGENGFCLNIYTPVAEERVYQQVHEAYRTEEEMEAVYENADILVVPSLWRETFGFVVLEALSFGIPVIVTEYVGAGSLIENGRNGYCIKAQKEEWKNCLRNLIQNRDILTGMNENIMSSSFEHSMEEHVRKLSQIYSELKQSKEKI